MKNSIDDVFKDVNQRVADAKKMHRAGLIGGGLGIAAGIAGGIYVGTELNGYIDALKQAPAAIQYTVDGAAAIVGALVVSRLGAAIAILPGVMYRRLKRS